MTKLTADQLSTLIRAVQSWAPDANPVLVEVCVRRAWGIMDIDPYDVAPIAFVGALLRAGLTDVQMDAILQVTEHLVASMVDWNPVEDVPEESGGTTRSIDIGDPFPL